MTERPVIVWDALLVKPEPTGVGRSILELARAMSTEDRGLSFVVLSCHPELFSFLENIPHWRVHHCAGARGGTLRKALYTQLELPRLVQRLGGHLLHSLQFVAPLRWLGPSVVTVHDLGYLHFADTVEEPRRSYYRLLVPRSLRQATRIVANSEATATDVAGSFPKVADRITVTRWGTPSWVWEQAPVARERIGTAPFLFVGTLEPRKNLAKLLAAYELFLAEHQDGPGAARLPDLVLVGGEGWLNSSFKSAIRKLQKKGKLRLEGYSEPSRLWDFYGSACALLFPSLHEGFGFPILEAMAAGLPVLTSDRGAMQEVAGDAALLVDPASVEEIAAGLTRLWSDENLRGRLCRQGPERARSFTWSRTAAETAAVYREMLGLTAHSLSK